MSIDECRHGKPWESPCPDCVSENISSEKRAMSEEEERIRMLEAMSAEYGHSKSAD